MRIGVVAIASWYSSHLNDRDWSKNPVTISDCAYQKAGCQSMERRVIYNNKQSKQSDRFAWKLVIPVLAVMGLFGAIDKAYSEDALSLIHI